jgi:hypothetical protein
MTLVLLTLQIQIHEYFRHFNIVRYADLCNLLFYAINMDVMSLFAYSFILFLVIFFVTLTLEISHFFSSKLS